MADDLRRWLNGKRDFYDGIVLYAKFGNDAGFLAQLKKGRTDRMHQLLNKRLENIYENNVQNTVEKEIIAPINATNATETEIVALPGADNDVKTERTANNKAIAQLKADADLTYKDVMNLRAVLFAKCKDMPGSEMNSPERIEERRKLAIGVVTGWQKVSEQYDKYRYATEHGQLPVADDKDTDDATAIPDAMVKHRLTTLRIYLKRTEKQEPTPARLAKIEGYKKQIAILEQRWETIKPQR